MGRGGGGGGGDAHFGGERPSLHDEKEAAKAYDEAAAADGKPRVNFGADGKELPRLGPGAVVGVAAPPPDEDHQLLHVDRLLRCSGGAGNGE